MSYLHCKASPPGGRRHRVVQWEDKLRGSRLRLPLRRHSKISTACEVRQRRRCVSMSFGTVEGGTTRDDKDYSISIAVHSSAHLHRFSIFEIFPRTRAPVYLDSTAPCAWRRCFSVCTMRQGSRLRKTARGLSLWRRGVELQHAFFIIFL